MISSKGGIILQTHTSQEAMVQNLKAAGCGSEIITRFMTCQDAGKTQEALRVLALHRASLLDELHTSRSKLDCLDYLIYQIRAEQKK